MRTLNHKVNLKNLKNSLLHLGVPHGTTTASSFIQTLTKHMISTLTSLSSPLFSSCLSFQSVFLSPSQPSPTLSPPPTGLYTHRWCVIQNTFIALFISVYWQGDVGQETKADCPQDLLQPLVFVSVIQTIQLSKRHKRGWVGRVQKEGEGGQVNVPLIGLRHCGSVLSKVSRVLLTVST